jgi:phosphate/sulfate permease
VDTSFAGASSSHALIGGLVGAALANTGFSALQWWGIGKTVLFILLAPLIGMALGLSIAVAVAWIVSSTWQPKWRLAAFASVVVLALAPLGPAVGVSASTEMILSKGCGERGQPVTLRQNRD